MSDGSRVIAQSDETRAEAGWIWPTLVVILSVTSAAALSLAIWLYLWRRRLPDGQVSIVPELLLAGMGELERATADQSASLRRVVATHTHDINEIRKAFAVFATVAAQKDQEIARLKEGGDRQVYAMALRRLIRVLRLAEADIAEDLAAGKDVSALASIRRHLLGALADLGLQTFEPADGSDYRSRQDVAESPATSPTTDLALDWTIRRTVSPGFLLSTTASPLLVEKAIVEIHRFESEEAR